MVPVRGPRERYVSVWCNDDVDYEDRGPDSPRQRTEYSGRQIANDLLFSDSIKTDAAGRGFFIAAGDKPTEEELQAAEKKLKAYRQGLISEARFSFQKNRHTRGLNDECFWAAERMGLEEEWMPLAANPCPNCGRAVKSTAATCVHCNLILDEKKYSELHFAVAPTGTPQATGGLRPAGPAR
jgi:hypothetical protein